MRLKQNFFAQIVHFTYHNPVIAVETFVLTRNVTFDL